MRLKRRLLRRTGKAIQDYHMIVDGDRIMVCLSGGKDSYTMLTLLRDLQRRAPVRFELLAVHLNHKQPNFPDHVIPAFLEEIKQPYQVIEADIFRVVNSKLSKGDTPCFLCARLRRGILYSQAKALHCNKIALGHHADDILETLLLNMIFNGTIKAMPPVLKSNNGYNIVIRPLAYCREIEIERFATLMKFPIVQSCLCGLPGSPKRKRMKQLINDLASEIPMFWDNMLASLGRVIPSHLMDTKMYDFKNSCNQRNDDE